VNNAGVVLTKNQLSKYDLEEMLTVNHLGTFLITMNLLDIIETSKGRIVTVASDAHSFSGKLTKEKLEQPFIKDSIGTEPGAFATMQQYGLTKLCNILFIRELNKELRKKNSSILVFSINPGWVETELGGDGKGSFVRAIESLVAQTPQEGSYPSFYCACDPSVTIAESGSYYDGVAKKGALKDYAKNDDDAKFLWDWSLQKLETKLQK